MHVGWREIGLVPHRDYAIMRVMSVAPEGDVIAIMDGAEEEGGVVSRPRPTYESMCCIYRVGA